MSQLPELKVLWADGESNFMGIFVSGPMLGRLALVGHDTNIDCAPLYRSLDSFIETTKDGFKTPDTEWPYQVDYPNTGNELQTNASRAEIEDDIACLEQIETIAASARDPFRKRFLYSCVASLTPKEHVARLVPMLESSDYHICGRACTMLGYYQFDKSCNKLAQIARVTNNPARFRAIDGLGLMKTSASKKALVELVRTGAELPGNITTALKMNSFEVSVNRHSTASGKIIEWYVHFSKESKLEKLNISDGNRPGPWDIFGLA